MNCMINRAFIDTNILVYARDRDTPDKQVKAAYWLGALADKGLAYVNLQVLNEFTRVLFKRSQRLSLDDIRAEVDDAAVWGRRALQPEDVRVAWMVREALGYQWFDCLLLASASNDGCDVFLSEDMTDGARFGDLVIVNPFLHHPDDFLASD
jgi:predicted nucleic acid-binding protein